MTGQTISHYRILEKLGEGGMGVVYKAQDTKLDRIVALKFLPRHLLCDSEAKTRFENEAKAASALNQTNITTIYEINEVEGECFICMEYVEGKSVKELIEEKTLSIEEVLKIAIQIAEGLNAAHKKDIVHRDIKSDNIMLTHEGLVKIMDFGLAKLKGVSKLTKTGSTLGTMQYMSPEQAQGIEVDQRSDIFSFGVVLYEMITGQLPFKGEHEAAVIYSILNETPEPLARYKAGVPGELQRVVDKTLAKNRDERYQHVDEMIADLKSIRRKLETTPTIHEPGKPKRLKKRSVYVYVSFAFLIIILILIKIFFFTSSREPIDSLAVLPLQNLSGDVNQEYFSDGMTEALITELQKIKSLRVISRTSVMQYKKVQKLLPQIAKELNVKAVVEGSVSREGDIVRINVQLIQASPEKHLWADNFDRTMKNILALQSEVAQAIAREVKAVVTPEEQRRMESSRSVNPEAYEAYLKGRFYWNKRRGDDLKTAIEYFNQAIEKDPNYALAYAGLASTYVILPEYSGLPPKEIMPKAEAAAKKALEFNATLGEAHAVLALKRWYEWDWVGAESEFKRTIELNPSYPTTHHWYSNLLRSLGRLDEALAEIKLAQELDPLSLVINMNVGITLSWMRRYDEAIDQFKKTLELDPNFPFTYGNLGALYEVQGKFDEAIPEFQKAITVVGRDASELSDLGHAYALAGKKSEALKILDELFKFSKQGYSVSFEIAFVYYGLGDKNASFEWLEKAYQERNNALVNMKVDPLWDSLRSDLRFIALLKKMGLEK